MGELADDMINGLSCTGCGVYFESEHGYPVLCENCYDENESLPKATIPEL